MHRQPDISLTAEEQALLERLPNDAPSDHEGWVRAQPVMTELAQRLLERHAIPEARLRYFTDPDCNSGGRGNSRKDLFERNLREGDDILTHPHFLKYLLYFLYGPDLPSEVITQFKEAAYENRLSGSEVLDLAPSARAAVRRYGMNPVDASEEFFKLAVECGAAPWSADTLRRSVRAVR